MRATQTLARLLGPYKLWALLAPERGPHTELLEPQDFYHQLYAWQLREMANG